MGRRTSQVTLLSAALVIALVHAPPANAQLVQALKVESKRVVEEIQAANLVKLQAARTTLDGEQAADAQRILDVRDEDQGLTIRRTNTFISRHGKDLGRDRALEEVPNDPDVLFALGYGGRFASDSRGEHALGIETNVAGAALGALFNGIGSVPLREYFETHVTLAAVLPERDLPVSRVAIGLGVLKFGKFTMVPALAFEEADSSDARVPREVVRESGKHTRWSSPALSLSFTLPDLPGVVLSLGGTFPFYYPGNAPAALGKLFAFDDDAFERSGRGAFTMQVGIPLQKLPKRKSAN